jgi:hypothetical protein
MNGSPAIQSADGSATNRHEWFRGEAALEGVGPPVDGFAVANLTPLSGARLLVSEVLVSFGVFGG